MKSNKQRRLEIKTKRRARAEALKGLPFKANFFSNLYSIAANHSELTHNITCGPYPSFYRDKPFKCQACGAHEVWTANSQKWWFEIAKGNLYSTAIHCRSCRAKVREEKEQQRVRMSEAAKREPHPNEAFFKKCY